MQDCKSCTAYLSYAAYFSGNVKSCIADGQVLIGDCTPYYGEYRLFVRTGIRTEKIRVDVASANDWSDYVFHEDYKLLSLEETELFINKEKHLPNVPNSEEVMKNGIDLAEMDALLLSKIEELT